MSVPIIIVQTDSDGVGASECNKELALARLKEGEEYVVLSNPWAAEAHVEPGVRQLLVTGSFRGSIDPAVRLVVQMKAKNPLIRTVLFSTRAAKFPEGVFDHEIAKGSGGSFAGDLVRACQRFLAEAQTSG